MIPKEKLINKYIMYLDKNGKYRIEKVVKVVGKTLTLKNAYKEKHRIHPNKKETCHRIFGVVIKRKIILKKQSEYLEEIKW